ncbi:MAG: hypothetical protein P4L46_04010 [Fimbriimonas sp.]|nr:hypothetical protein [Fimbriimonas sp.]
MSDTGMNHEDIRDEQGRIYPPYVYHAVIGEDNYLGYRSSFPAYHHAYLIEAFLNYYVYSGDPDALRRAIQLADWTIDHSTPSNWKWPYLPWSTFSEGKPGGYEDKDNLQPDKVGYMGLSYTRLFKMTGNRKYLAAAIHAADTLVAHQGWEGDWPFRVNPKTDIVFQQYSSALFMNVAFLEEMWNLTRNKDYKNGQILAWLWMMRNPVRSNNWSGLYEDIPKDSGSQVHYSPLQTIRLLLRYCTPVNSSSYVDKARKLYDYTMDGLAFHDPEWGLILHEQTGYLASTPSSTMDWSMMSSEFYLYSGEEKYRLAALEAVRMVSTYSLKPDGRTHNTVMGARTYGDIGSWYSLGSGLVRYMVQDMGCLPELCPDRETHVLRSSSQVRTVTYTDRTIRYSSLGGSVELIKTPHRPAYVSMTDPGTGVRATLTKLSMSKDLAPNSYLYNPKSHVLLIRHDKPSVVVTLGTG